MIDLTPIEFREFNINSRMKLLKKDGKLLNFNIIDHQYKMLLYVVYGFHVQCIFDFKNSKVEDVRIVISNNWMNYHNLS